MIVPLAQWRIESYRALIAQVFGGVQLAEACQKLKKALPNASILVGPDDVDQICELMNGLRTEIELKQNFLLAIAPLLSTPIARKNIEATWNKIINLNESFNISNSLLLLLAILSSISVQNGASPAKGIFKFKRNFTKKDAYNAASDFQSLDLLTYASALFPSQFPVMITKDKSLALFWAGIGPKNFGWNDGEICFDFSPHPEVLPDYALGYLTATQRNFLRK